MGHLIKSTTHIMFSHSRARYLKLFRKFKKNNVTYTTNLIKESLSRLFIFKGLKIRANKVFDFAYLHLKISLQFSKFLKWRLKCFYWHWGHKGLISKRLWRQKWLARRYYRILRRNFQWRKTRFKKFFWESKRTIHQRQNLFALRTFRSYKFFDILWFKVNKYLTISSYLSFFFYYFLQFNKFWIFFFFNFLRKQNVSSALYLNLSRVHLKKFFRIQNFKFSQFPIFVNLKTFFFFYYLNWKYTLAFSKFFIRNKFFIVNFLRILSNRAKQITLKPKKWLFSISKRMILRNILDQRVEVIRAGKLSRRRKKIIRWNFHKGRRLRLWNFCKGRRLRRSCWKPARKKKKFFFFRFMAKPHSFLKKRISLAFPLSSDCISSFFHKRTHFVVKRILITGKKRFLFRVRMYNNYNIFFKKYKLLFFCILKNMKFFEKQKLKNLFFISWFIHLFYLRNRFTTFKNKKNLFLNLKNKEKRINFFFKKALKKNFYLVAKTFFREKILKNWYFRFRKRYNQNWNRNKFRKKVFKFFKNSNSVKKLPKKKFLLPFHKKLTKNVTKSLKVIYKRYHRKKIRKRTKKISILRKNWNFKRARWIATLRGIHSWFRPKRKFIRFKKEIRDDFSYYSSTPKFYWIFSLYFFSFMYFQDFKIILLTLTHVMHVNYFMKRIKRTSRYYHYNIIRSFITVDLSFILRYTLVQVTAIISANHYSNSRQLKKRFVRGRRLKLVYPRIWNFWKRFKALVIGHHVSTIFKKVGLRLFFNIYALITEHAVFLENLPGANVRPLKRIYIRMSPEQRRQRRKERARLFWEKKRRKRKRKRKKRF